MASTERTLPITSPNEKPGKLITIFSLCMMRPCSVLPLILKGRAAAGYAAGVLSSGISLLIALAYLVLEAALLE